MTEAKKTRKRGRPKLPKGESKAAFLRVRFSVDDLKRIEEAAKVSDKTVSQWIRDEVRDSLLRSLKQANLQGSHLPKSRKIRRALRDMGHSGGLGNSPAEAEN